MPSTISTSVSSALASSTVMTPSLPTFCIASAIILPTAASPFDEMVPTWATSDEDATFFERFLMSSTTAATAISMPRLRSIGFMPAATALAPSLTIACASTVAVVVPSPAMSLVFCATSRTICAPMFSNLSSSSISLATVTPSLVMRGAPNDLSSTTLRPLGPSVTRTALVRMSTPRNIRSRASTENFTSLALILLLHWMWVRQRLRGLLAGDRLIEHAHDVALFHDEVIDAVELDLGPGPFSKQHDLAGLQIDGNQFAVLVAAPGTGGDDLALGGFLLRRIGNDDPACALFFGVDALDYNPIMKRTKLHIVLQIRLRWFSGRTKARGEAAHSGRQRCPETPLCTLNPGARQWRLLAGSRIRQPLYATASSPRRTVWRTSKPSNCGWSR